MSPNWWWFIRPCPGGARRRIWRE